MTVQQPSDSLVEALLVCACFALCSTGPFPPPPHSYSYIHACTHPRVLLRWLRLLARLCVGIYWFVPICAASLTVGLTVDYDVFLISRVFEYRHAAYSTEASILRAVGKQSTTITTAGCIMAIAFSSVRKARQS